MTETDKSNRPILSKSLLRGIQSRYRKAFHMRCGICDPRGRLEVPDAKPRDWAEINRPALHAVRAQALIESVRWGEPYSFFLAPGVISWMIPLVNGDDVRGGLVGGHVVADRDPYSLMECINHLTAAGCTRSGAERLVSNLPIWPHEAIHRAANALFLDFYAASGWTPRKLQRNREQALQQRQIAEEIHEHKKGGGRDAKPMDEERILLSLMKAGDQKGARRELNKMLGSMFSLSPNLNVLRARVIEMMGYLVRTAVEDSPASSALIEQNHEWMARIIESHDFETLAAEVREGLDAFMQNVYLLGRSRANSTVWKVLSYLETHYREPITLKDVARHANLSTYRISHLMKDVTEHSVFQHVIRLRVREAQRLLERTDMSCTEIAYDVGFSDQSYFIKQFKHWMGITPARYRRLYRRDVR